MNKEKFFRCAFITRGRGQGQIDELLPEWARIVLKHNSAGESEFNRCIDQELVRLAGGVEPKTAANYRTETLGKILGLYYTTPEKKVFASERAERLVKTSDQFQFFKDLVCKMQAPSGISKNAASFIEKRISFMPAAFVLQCLLEAEKKGSSFISKQEIFWFLLSNLDVLQGKVSESIIVDEIISKRRKWKYRKYLEGSRETQHANEMINLLKYANLIKIEGKYGNVSLNKTESRDIEIIIKYAKPGIGFQAYEYAMGNPGDFKKYEQDWEKYFATPCFKDEKVFATDFKKSFGPIEVERFDDDDKNEIDEISTKEIGDTGERYVFDCERKKVQKYMPGERRRVHLLSHLRGIGFDVQSVRVDSGPDHDDYIYIEVKTTPRATRPQNLCHSASLTENEYKAARQHGKNYFIYKVYLTPNGKHIFKLQNPFKRKGRELGIIKEGKTFRVNSSPCHWSEEKSG